MLNFNTIEDLVSHMFECTDNEDNLVSVVADKEMSVEIMKELLNYENVILNSCNIDFNEEYDREYIVSLLDDVDSDNWYVNVEKSYIPDNDKYVSTDGYVLFHEDVNSKAMVDMQNNEFMPLGDHDWFVVGEADGEIEHTYKVNGKPVDKETYDGYVSKFAPVSDLADKEDDLPGNDNSSITVKCNLDVYEVLKIIKDIERRIMNVDDMLREMDCFRRLLNW